jgi:hypothetical protein
MAMTGTFFVLFVTKPRLPLKPHMLTLKMGAQYSSETLYTFTKLHSLTTLKITLTMRLFHHSAHHALGDRWNRLSCNKDMSRHSSQ